MKGRAPQGDGGKSKPGAADPAKGRRYLQSAEKPLEGASLAEDNYDDARPHEDVKQRGWEGGTQKVEAALMPPTAGARPASAQPQAPALPASSAVMYETPPVPSSSPPQSSAQRSAPSDSVELSPALASSPSLSLDAPAPPASASADSSSPVAAYVSSSPPPFLAVPLEAVGLLPPQQRAAFLETARRLPPELHPLFLAEILRANAAALPSSAPASEASSTAPRKEPGPPDANPQRRPSASGHGQPLSPPPRSAGGYSGPRPAPDDPLERRVRSSGEVQPQRVAWERQIPLPAHAVPSALASIPGVPHPSGAGSYSPSLAHAPYAHAHGAESLVAAAPERPPVLRLSDSSLPRSGDESYSHSVPQQGASSSLPYPQDSALASAASAPLSYTYQGPSYSSSRFVPSAAPAASIPALASAPSRYGMPSPAAYDVHHLPAGRAPPPPVGAAQPPSAAYVTAAYAPSVYPAPYPYSPYPLSSASAPYATPYPLSAAPSVYPPYSSASAAPLPLAMVLGAAPPPPHVVAEEVNAAVDSAVNHATSVVENAVKSAIVGIINPATYNTAALLHGLQALNERVYEGSEVATKALLDFAAYRRSHPQDTLAQLVNSLEEATDTLNQAATAGTPRLKPTLEAAQKDGNPSVSKSGQPLLEGMGVFSPSKESPYTPGSLQADAFSAAVLEGQEVGARGVEPSSPRKHLSRKDDESGKERFEETASRAKKGPASTGGGKGSSEVLSGQGADSADAGLPQEIIDLRSLLTKEQIAVIESLTEFLNLGFDAALNFVKSQSRGVLGLKQFPFFQPLQQKILGMYQRASANRDADKQRLEEDERREADRRAALHKADRERQFWAEIQREAAKQGLDPRAVAERLIQLNAQQAAHDSRRGGGAASKARPGLPLPHSYQAEASVPHHARGALGTGFPLQRSLVVRSPTVLEGESRRLSPGAPIQPHAALSVSPGRRLDRTANEEGPADAAQDEAVENDSGETKPETDAAGNATEEGEGELVGAAKGESEKKSPAAAPTEEKPTSASGGDNASSMQVDPSVRAGRSEERAQQASSDDTGGKASSPRRAAPSSEAREADSAGNDREEPFLASRLAPSSSPRRLSISPPLSLSGFSAFPFSSPSAHSPPKRLPAPSAVVLPPVVALPSALGVSVSPSALDQLLSLMGVPENCLLENFRYRGLANVVDRRSSLSTCLAACRAAAAASRSPALAREAGAAAGSPASFPPAQSAPSCGFFSYLPEVELCYRYATVEGLLPAAGYVSAPTSCSVVERALPGRETARRADDAFVVSGFQAQRQREGEEGEGLLAQDDARGRLAGSRDQRAETGRDRRPAGEIGSFESRAGEPATNQHPQGRRGDLAIEEVTGKLHPAEREDGERQTTGTTAARDNPQPLPAAEARIPTAASPSTASSSPASGLPPFFSSASFLAASAVSEGRPHEERGKTSEAELAEGRTLPQASPRIDAGESTGDAKGLAEMSVAAMPGSRSSGKASEGQEVNVEVLTPSPSSQTHFFSPSLAKHEADAGVKDVSVPETAPPQASEGTRTAAPSPMRQPAPPSALATATAIQAPPTFVSDSLSTADSPPTSSVPPHFSSFLAPSPAERPPNVPAFSAPPEVPSHSAAPSRSYPQMPSPSSASLAPAAGGQLQRQQVAPSFSSPPANAPPGVAAPAPAPWVYLPPPSVPGASGGLSPPPAAPLPPSPVLVGAAVPAAYAPSFATPAGSFLPPAASPAAAPAYSGFAAPQPLSALSALAPLPTIATPAASTAGSLLQTTQGLMQAGNALMQAFPLQQLLDAGQQLYASGFFRNRGMKHLQLPGLGPQKQELPPPPGMEKPTVNCASEGMTCCVPENAAEKWKERPPFLNNHEKQKKCRAHFVSMLNSLCATTSYSLKGDAIRDKYAAGASFEDEDDNCGLVLTETRDFWIFHHTLVIPGKNMNNAICECKEPKAANEEGLRQIEGFATWEFSLQAVHAMEEQAARGEQIAKGLGTALALTTMLGQQGEEAIGHVLEHASSRGARK
ncbi:hypothetical protein BESB_010910 [Besnoitia besnoiti]|uniref:Uncharacterized protein n=1 Tax=Besnoitia besnoiti TaxID=94643 RepID=A0A2A9MLA5_BESBE|nr:hypothetical protein BESB_010910 [Besnoitia besnoiti]PFH38749.1 hypothetical protein BESB_010910 [Besnoitia besnoiti]